MEKEFDVTVFGATGLTGKHIVEHLYELASNEPTAFPHDFRWAVAGRNETALAEVVKTISSKYPKAIIQSPGIVIANVVRREQMDTMAKRSKVIINAVGPFRFMGEYVVRSCVEHGCDYVDVTGEPEFIERMQRTYHDQAARKKVTIVHACGFDSVPSDLGVLYIKRLFAARGWTPAHIEMFLRIYTGPSGLRVGYATFESAVHGFGSVELLREIRKVSNLAPLPRTGPKLAFHKRLTYDRELQMYHVPFQFADPSVVRLSQQLFLTGYGEPPKKTTEPMPPTIQFAAYVLLPSLWIAFLYLIYGFIFSFLAASPWGRNMLLRNPERFTHGVFSKAEPSDADLRDTHFEMLFRAKGYPSKIVGTGAPEQIIRLVVRGPEMGYIATPRIVLQCALTLLRKKPEQVVPLGVLTPSVAFWNTDLIEKLQLVGITFEQEE